MVGETKEFPVTPTVHSVLSPTRMYRYLSDPSGKTVVANVEGVADADCFSPRENEARGGAGAESERAFGNREWSVKTSTHKAEAQATPRDIRPTCTMMHSIVPRA